MKKKLGFILGMTAAGLLTAGALAGCGEAKLYKVVFNTQGGTEVAPLTIEWGKKLSELPTTTREGYTFTDWYTDQACTNKYNVNTEIETDLVLYAGWSVNQYTISFSTGVEGLTFDPITGNYGSSFEVPDSSKMQRDYYIFDAWYYDADFKTKYSTTDKIPSKNSTLYANWIAYSITLKFDANDPDAVGSMNQEVIKESDSPKTIPVCKFTSEGKAFKGWSLTPDGEVVYTDGQALNHVEKNAEIITLYAQWEVKEAAAKFYSIENGAMVKVATGDVLKFGEHIVAPDITPECVGHIFNGWGRMVKTKDTSAHFEKQYFEKNSATSYVRKTVEEGENVAAEGYYEVEIVSIPSTTISENNDFYANFTRKEITVSFIDSVTGESFASTTGLYNAHVMLPEIPSKVGYTSAGWFKDAACQEKYTNDELSAYKFPSENAAVYLKYTINSHKLAFYNGVNTNPIKVVNAVEFASAIDFPNPESFIGEGERFIGWFEDPVRDIPFEETNMPDRDLTLYAHVEMIGYTAKFYDGNNLLGETVYTYGEKIVRAQPTKEGYSFEGWYTTSDFQEGTRITSNVSEMPAQDLNIYAKFVAKSFAINLSYEGGSSASALTRITVFYGDKLSEVLPSDVTKNGYIFTGWAMKNGTRIDDDTLMPNYQFDLYAQYIADNAKITINYVGQKLDGDGYEPIGNPSSVIVNSKTGASYLVDDADAPAIEGFDFEKAIPSPLTVGAGNDNSIELRYTRESYQITYKCESHTDIVITKKYQEVIPAQFVEKGYQNEYFIGTTKIDNLSKLVITEDTTITVVQNAVSNQVSYSANGGIFEDESTSFNETHTTGEEFDLPTVTRKGYTFLGWTFEQDSTDIDIPADTKAYTMPNDSIALYAQWEIKEFVITIDNEGTKTPTSLAYGSEFTLPTQEGRTGYTFKGYKSSSATAVDYEAGDKYIVSDHDETFTCVWNENVVTVSFDANGADSGSMENVDISFTSTRKLPANQFSKYGYEFVGWKNGDDTYADEAVLPESFFDAENKTLELTADWEIGEYTITFDCSYKGIEPVSVPQNIVADYGETITEPDVIPEIKGYEFGGWLVETSEGTFKPFYFNTMPGADTTVYVNWVPAKYHVIFDSVGGYCDTPKALNDQVVANESTLEGITLPDAESMHKTGFDFDGWYIGDVKLTDQNLKNFSIASDDIIVTAHWIAKSYTVNFYTTPDASTWGEAIPENLVESKQYQYGEQIEEPSTIPGPTDTNFVGWYIKVNTSTTEVPSYEYVYYDLKAMPDENIDLFAKFSTSDYQIEYYDENHNLIYSVSSSNVYTKDNPFYDYICLLYQQYKAYEVMKNAADQAAVGELDQISAIAVWCYTHDVNVADDDLRIFALTGGAPHDATKLAAAQQILAGASTLGGEFKMYFLGAVQAFQAGQDPTSFVMQMAGVASNEAENSLVSAFMNQTEDDITYITGFAVAVMPIENVKEQILGSLGEAPKPLFTMLEGLLDLNNSGDKAFISIIGNVASAEDQTTAMMLATGAITKRYTDFRDDYYRYEGNAYNPTSSDVNNIFDGWSKSENDEGGVANNPHFIQKATPITNLVATATSNTSVEFSWDADEDAYGYRVQIIRGEVTDTKVVTTNSIKVNDLKKGEVVKVIVYKLSKYANGEYRAESSEFKTISVADGSELKVSPVSLDSEGVELSYFHTVEDEIGKVDSYGSYWYKTENKEYIFFTNTSYAFPNSTIEDLKVTNPTIAEEVEKLAKVEVNAKGETTLEIKNITGLSSFNLKVDGELYTAIIREIPDIIASGSQLSKSESAIITTNSTNSNVYSQADYLGNGRKTYKIGRASTAHVPGASLEMFDQSGALIKSNGVKFDIQNISTNSKVIRVDRDYKFEKYNGSAWVEVPNTIYTYDKDNDVFYFNEGTDLGLYRLTVTPQADTDSKKNTYVPNAFKNDAKKMERLTKVFEFELVDGANVYTSFDLREAFGDVSSSTINIQSKIDAKFSASSLAYVKYLQESENKTVGDMIMGDLLDTGLGDADIVDGTAIMDTDTKYGPKIWELTTDAEYAFKDAEGKFYKYSKTGTFCIKDAEFVSNFDNGQFKIISLLDQDNCETQLQTLHYRTGSAYHRRGEALELTVNGNYYDIDGSKIPFVRSSTHNTAAGESALYEIQNVSSAMFYNMSPETVHFNALTLIGNTSNQNELLNDESKGVAEIMRLTSGGISGFKTNKPSFESRTMPRIDLESVNVYNTLIALYADAGIDANYVHVKDSWANGLYTYARDNVVVNIAHSVIEASGGCAVQVDDQVYGLAEAAMDKEITNPTLNIDFATTSIQNLVSGEEQWFKGYSMELVAMKLKTMINDSVSALSGGTKTILKEVINPVTKLPSYCMNWVSFTQTNNASDTDAKELNRLDLGTVLGMNGGNDFQYVFDTKTGSYQKVTLDGQVYIDTDEHVVDGKLEQYQYASNIALNNPATGEPIPLGNIPVMDVANPDSDQIAVFITSVKTNVATGEQEKHEYLYFRLYQSGFGMIQGVVEVYNK